MIQKKKTKLRARCDVAFIIDFSASMRWCIESVRKQVDELAGQLDNAGPNVVLDWRIGLIAQDRLEFHILDFTTEVSRFKAALAGIKRLKADEFTAVAIDAAQSLSWREDANRFLVIFTDEPLKGGHNAAYQRQHFETLLSKLARFKYFVFYFGPDCPDYRKIKTQKIRSYYHPIEKSFEGLDFSELMKDMGRTVTQVSISTMALPALPSEIQAYPDWKVKIIHL